MRVARACPSLGVDTRDGKIIKSKHSHPERKIVRERKPIDAPGYREQFVLVSPVGKDIAFLHMFLFLFPKGDHLSDGRIGEHGALVDVDHGDALFREGFVVPDKP